MDLNSKSSAGRNGAEGGDRGGVQGSRALRRTMLCEGGGYWGRPAARG